MEFRGLNAKVAQGVQKVFTDTKYNPLASLYRKIIASASNGESFVTDFIFEETYSDIAKHLTDNGFTVKVVQNVGKVTNIKIEW